MLPKFFRSTLLLAVVASGSAWATPFEAKEFDALNQEGRAILVDVHADWCPTCKTQDAIVSALLKTAEFKGITALRVDFDKQKDVLKRFKVMYQSTLIVFKGGKEVGRSTGDTQKDSLSALLKKAI
ncbi:MAG TPA: thioredoxin family protein [Rhodocyclaceae bacterium]|nr:thioredoxin family protein [Rhodocyclaceae bacterium]